MFTRLSCKITDKLEHNGTIYLRARYYNPSIGRFISRDSFAGKKSDPLSLNLYTYCANNPIVYIDPSGRSYGVLPDGSKMSINSAWDAKKFYELRDKQLADGVNNKNSTSSQTDAPGCTKECFSPGCSGCNSVVVVAREGNTNKDNKRFNATITVYSVDGKETSFVGSTLPDDINGRYDTGKGYAIVKSGTYKITKGNNHVNASAYNVQTLDDGWYIPCIRDSNSGWIEDTASGILVHRAEDGYTNIPWSTGCITIEGVDNMNRFSELVGPSAFLIIDRS